MSSEYQKLAQILEWLYTRDGDFCDKNEWRKALIVEIKKLLLDSPEEPVEEPVSQ